MVFFGRLLKSEVRWLIRSLNTSPLHVDDWPANSTILACDNSQLGITLLAELNVDFDGCSIKIEVILYDNFL